jgi:23S rRNA (cytidine1920-2'-O)/16S rRNA (cytidine1409-2'-O)-methyltransferase
MSKKLRLDQFLVEKGLFASREQAQRAVMAGEIKVGTRIAVKASQFLDSEAAITVKPTRNMWARRVEAGKRPRLFQNRHARKDRADIGAKSTGGFTDFAAARRRKNLCGVDVGHGQLA